MSQNTLTQTLTPDEEDNILLNAMTEAEQLEHYIKYYNESKVYYRKTILQMMTTTQSEIRDDIVNKLNEEILQIDKSLNGIYKYKQLHIL